MAPGTDGRNSAAPNPWGVRILPYLVVFAVAMGYLEAAVVVYLRGLYYPDGFQFPIVIIKNRIALVEIGREFSTLVMMAVPAYIAARTAYERLAVFSLLFGVWDISYYVFLKVALGWPESVMTWDILFLLPVPWVGPVIAPCIVSVCLIGGALTVLRMEDRGVRLRARPWEWFLAVAGALTVVLSFTLDFGRVIQTGEHGVFKWPLFAAGLALGWVGFGSMTRRALGQSRRKMA
jgi:hypothetical protein